MPDEKHNISFKELAIVLMRSVEKTLIALCKLRIIDGGVRRRSIVTWAGQMKLFGMEKYHNFSYMTLIDLYRNETERTANTPFGMVILYIKRADAFGLLSMMGLDVPPTDIDYSDPSTQFGDQTLCDSCGELCNIIVGGFKTHLIDLGYPEMIVSTPTCYINTESIDVNYDGKENYKYELHFVLEVEGGTRDIYLDLVMPTNV